MSSRKKNKSTEAPTTENTQTATPSAENNGTHATETATPPTVAGTPVEQQPTTPPNGGGGFLRTPGQAPAAPVQPAAAQPQEDRVSTATQPQATPNTSAVVDEFKVALDKVKDRITAITTTIASEEEQLQAQKAGLDAQFEKRREELNNEKEALITKLESAGVVWGNGQHVPAKRGKPGRKPGSTVAKAKPAKASGKGKRGGRRGDGPSAGDMIMTMVHDADNPVELKAIRKYLRQHGKNSNPSMETKRLCEEGKLKRMKDGFVLGRKA